MVTSQNYKEFSERSDKPKVLYFTDKKSTSATMKAMSKRYLDKLSFGEVRSTDQLAKEFSVAKYPTLMLLTVDEQI